MKFDCQDCIWESGSAAVAELGQAAAHATNNMEQKQPNGKSLAQALSIGIGVGVGVGSGIGTALGVIMHNIGVGIAMGVGIGISLDAATGAIIFSLTRTKRN